MGLTTFFFLLKKLFSSLFLCLSGNNFVTLYKMKYFVWKKREMQSHKGKNRLQCHNFICIFVSYFCNLILYS